MRRPATGGEAARARRGQAMTEFGLVLPLIILIFMGVVELGMILHDYLAQVSANAAAARYGAKNFGVVDANERIIDRFLEDRGHLNPAFLTFHSATGASLGTFNKTAGTVTKADGSAPNLSVSTFFMWDNDTPDTMADDVPIACTNVRASYVKVKTVYQHKVIIPGLDIITQSDTFPLTVEHVIPVSAVELGTNPDVNPDHLSGGFPITVMNREWVVGKEYVLKGKADEEPGNPGNADFGNFGWVNLDGEVGGNKNEKIVGWIRGENSPTVRLPGYLGGFTGQRNASDIRAALDLYKGKIITILIHDVDPATGAAFRGTGSNLEYYEVGVALFLCEDFTENIDGGGQPHLEVSGKFVKRLF